VRRSEVEKEEDRGRRGSKGARGCKALGFREGIVCGG
jgi:hypothetical protein